MRIIAAVLCSLSLFCRAHAFIVAVEFPTICDFADLVAVVRIDAKAGRVGWDATVCENLSAREKNRNIRLLRIVPEPAPAKPDDEVIVVGDDPDVSLVVGARYVAFLRHASDGTGYLPAASGFDSFYIIEDGKVSGLLPDEAKERRITVAEAKAVTEIRKAFRNRKGKPNRPRGTPEKVPASTTGPESWRP
jgi:hypothetical protein